MAKVASGQALRSVERLLSALGSFSTDEPRRTLSEISNELDLAASTVRRLLIKLTEAGLAEFDERSGRYSLHSGSCARLVDIAVAGELVQTGQSFLDALHEATGETVILAMLDGTEGVHIDVRRSTQFVSAFNPIGFRIVPYAGGAIGKVLLAWRSTEEVLALLPEGGEWAPRTHRSITDADRFLKHLSTIRRRGWAYNDRETDDEAWAVAAPVRDELGRVVAALHIPVPASRANKPLRDKLTEAVASSANGFTDAMRRRKSLRERRLVGDAWGST